MAGSYTTFDVSSILSDGVSTAIVPSVTLKIWNVTDNVASSVTVSSNSNGTVPSGTISDVVTGKTVRFRVENYNGMAGFVEQVLG